MDKFKVSTLQSQNFNNTLIVLHLLQTFNQILITQNN